MKKFKRGVCQLCVLFAALGVLLLAGALIEGTLPAVMALGGALALIVLAEGVCRFVFFPDPAPTNIRRSAPRPWARRHAQPQPFRHAA